MAMTFILITHFPMLLIDIEAHSYKHWGENMERQKSASRRPEPGVIAG
jgi:hypothetical protein